MNRLKEIYRDEIAPALFKELNLKNVMQVPGIEKVIVNIGVGEALDNPKALDAALNDLTIITGQRPVVLKAKKDISNFKLRAGRQIGVKVTLRGEKMWAFLDRLINVALPRLRDLGVLCCQNLECLLGKDKMAKKCMVYREMRRKYPNQVVNRCRRCGRPRGYMRKFGLCRICFRELALQGKIPGVVKSSW